MKGIYDKWLEKAPPLPYIPSPTIVYRAAGASERTFDTVYLHK